MRGILTCEGAQYGFHSREGRGSCFWIRLASTAATPQPTTDDAPQPAARVGARPCGSGRCLVIDDDLMVRSAWETLMQSWGVEVACVEFGAQALGRLEASFITAASGAMISGELDSPELAAAEEQGYLVLRKPVEPAEQAVLGDWLSGS